MPRRRTRQRPPVDFFANNWARWIVSLALHDQFVPWAQWLRVTWDDLPILWQSRQRPPLSYSLLEQWRIGRSTILTALAELGLEATVYRTDGAVELADHESNAAGFVRVHAPSDYVRPGMLPSTLLGTDRESRYAQEMLRVHELVPAGDRLQPRTLREFCGQVVDHDQVHDLVDIDKLRDLDHLRVWFGFDELPVLTIEPNLDGDASRITDALSVAVEALGLPLSIDGPHPGVWTPSTTLWLVHWDHRRPPLAAETGPGVRNASTHELDLRRLDRHRLAFDPNRGPM